MIMNDKINVHVLVDNEDYTLLYIDSAILERAFLKLTFKVPGSGCTLVALESDLWELGWSSVSQTSNFITTEAPVVLDFSEEEDEDDLKEVCITQAQIVVDYVLHNKIPARFLAEC